MIINAMGDCIVRPSPLEASLRQIPAGAHKPRKTLPKPLKPVYELRQHTRTLTPACACLSLSTASLCVRIV